MTTPTSPSPRIALVLGGGGLKGFAHLGVLRALEEHGIRPTVFAGTSIGALTAAAYLQGVSIDEMERRAASLRKRDLFRLDHVGMLLERFRSTSIYLEEPLRALIDSLIPHRRFDELESTLLVNTVDLERGTQVVWGTPGLRDVPVADAVYASCALPGFFPPGQVGGRICIDGGTVDNMPVGVAALGMDAVIGVDVGSAELGHDRAVKNSGFASIYMRAASTMMHALQLAPLSHWSGPPMILVRPKVAAVDWFAFGHTEQLVAEGYRAAKAALEDFDVYLRMPGGVYPRRRVTVSVDRDRCTGCGLCVSLAPNLMGLDGSGKAYALTQHVEWSPADGDFVKQCPTEAIRAESQDPSANALSIAAEARPAA